MLIRKKLKELKVLVDLKKILLIFGIPFSGAFGEQLYIVNVGRHAFNHVSWLEVMRRETLGPNAVNFRGIVLTGWSRYDHFAVLCELLPAAMPRSGH